MGEGKDRSRGEGSGGKRWMGGGKVGGMLEGNSLTRITLVSLSNSPITKHSVLVP